MITLKTKHCLYLKGLTWTKVSLLHVPVDFSGVARGGGGQRGHMPPLFLSTYFHDDHLNASEVGQSSICET